MVIAQPVISNLGGSWVLKQDCLCKLIFTGIHWF